MTGPGGIVKTTCPYCGVGCGVLATLASDGSVGIKGDPDHPANLGRLCSKGAALGETLSLDERLLYPELYGKRVAWDVALDTIASAFARTIEKHGPDSVAIYGSGQLLTEDYYVANKLMKGFIGSANIDTNSRLCMASSVAGHKRAFGSDTVPGCYEDLELADLIVLVGSNLAWCHPVLYQRIAAAKQARPEMRVVLIDPRRTMTADIADLHLPVASDGDAAVFAGLLRFLDRSGALDHDYIADHTHGFADALALAENWTLARTAAASGVEENPLRTFFEWFATTRNVVTVYSQGVNQSAIGTDKVNAIINCHLATGRIGLPGMGPFSVTGQPNAMGGREVGGLSNMLAAHMEFSNPGDVERVRRFWNAPNLATRPGLKAVDLFDAIEAGTVRAVWIMATNPLDSLPEADRVRRALKTCEFVAVSDMSAHTDTIACAHLKLPAAGWGEKDGTVTNSERRISRQRAFLPLPGAARPDWWIICEIARRMGFADGFPYRRPAEIFAEHAALSAIDNTGARDFDLSDLAELSASGYDDLAPVQWPVRDGGTARLFGDGQFFTPDGRANFVAVDPPEPMHPAPGMFIVNTGRVRDHWHTMTRTGKTARLSAHFAEPFAEIHPHDARALGIAPASLVRLQNSHGGVVVRALITERQTRGHVFVPMHWTEQYTGQGRIDALIASRTDPHSGQPALKMGQAQLTPFAANWHGFLLSATKPHLSAFPYWALGRTDEGWRAEVAGEAPPASWHDFARDNFELPKAAQLLAFHDERSGRHSFAAFVDDRLVLAFYAGRGPVAVSRQWASAQLMKPHAPDTRAALLAGRPGADVPDTGAIVCACFHVGVNAIARAVTEGGCKTVDAVGAELKAGTNCGSCRAEIRGIINAQQLQAAE